MNTRIMLSGLSIVSALTLSGIAAYAFFTDTGTSTANIFGAGTIDLKLGNAGTGTSDTVTGTFGGSTLMPGASPIAATLSIRNAGTGPADHVDIATTDTIVQASAPPGSSTSNQMDKFLKITTLTYDAGDILPMIADNNSNGLIDLDDLEHNNLPGGDLQNLPLPDINVDHQLVMAVQLDGSAPNSVQGDSVTMSMTVTLDQAPPHGSPSPTPSPTPSGSPSPTPTST